MGVFSSMVPMLKEGTRLGELPLEPDPEARGGVRRMLSGLLGYSSGMSMLSLPKSIDAWLERAEYREIEPATEWPRKEYGSKPSDEG